MKKLYVKSRLQNQMQHEVLPYDLLSNFRRSLLNYFWAIWFIFAVIGMLDPPA